MHTFFLLFIISWTWLVGLLIDQLVFVSNYVNETHSSPLPLEAVGIAGSLDCNPNQSVSGSCPSPCSITRNLCFHLRAQLFPLPDFKVPGGWHPSVANNVSFLFQIIVNFKVYQWKLVNHIFRLNFSHRCYYNCKHPSRQDNRLMDTFIFSSTWTFPGCYHRAEYIL